MKKRLIFGIVALSIIFFSGIVLAGGDGINDNVNAWTNTGQYVTTGGGGNHGGCPFYGGGSYFIAGQQSGNAGLSINAQGNQKGNLGGQAGYTQGYDVSRNFPGGSMRSFSVQSANVFGNVTTCGCNGNNCAPVKHGCSGR